MEVRSSTQADRDAIRGIHRDAFGDRQGDAIAALTDALLDAPAAQPLLSLLAEEPQRPLGHILFTAVELQPQAVGVTARILAPLGVAQAFQGGGVGGALIQLGLSRLAAAGVDLVFVLGHPSYYPRFGFQPAGALGLEAPRPILPQQADAWMVRALRPGLLGHVQGRVRCAAPLDQPQHWRE